MFLILALCSWGGALFAPIAAADEESSSIQHVWVRVGSALLVTPAQEATDLGVVQTGEVCGSLRWRIDANVEAVKFYLAVSDLWKGGQPHVPGGVAPIKLLRSRGVRMGVEYGGPARGHDNLGEFKLGQGTIEEFPVWYTDSVTFESSQSRHFSQYLTTQLCWNQNDAEKPKGQYGGKVWLWAMVVPQLS